jgi:translation initiation factor 4G
LAKHCLYSSSRNSTLSDAFFTGQAPPPQRPDQGGGRRQSNNRGGQDYYDDIDDDYVPLVRSENQWKPSKDNSAMAKVEKQTKSILNKITKEKFDKLSAQICDIPILSYEMLTLVINLVYEKAISEPSFSDMYANLCYRLSQMAKKGTFIKIIESDEDGSVSYRWSNDVGTSDAEIMGPFEDEQQSIDAALAEEDIEPVQRGELELTLHRLLIRRGTFIKIMHAASEDKYYTVFFPIGQAVECGQQLSLEVFTSEIEAQNHATKMNTFKRSLLNKCEDEFKKQDIYTDWKLEKKEYEKNKADLSDKERKDKEEDLEFRKMKIKKQMLGNIKFSKWLVYFCIDISFVPNISTCIHSQLVNYTSLECSKLRL